MRNLINNKFDLIESVLVHGDTTPIFRGVRGRAGAPGPYIVNRLHPRPAANTSTTYMRMLDNHPKNSMWPKRGMSHVCTTDEDIADEFGSMHYVFPLVETKMGVVGKGDLWEVINGPDLNDIFYTLPVVRQQGDGGVSWPDVFRSARELDTAGTPLPMWVNSYDNVTNYTELMGDTYAVMSYSSNPSMSLIDYDVGTHIQGDTEVWFEGPALYIPYQAAVSVVTAGSSAAANLRDLLSQDIPTMTVGRQRRQ